MTTRLPKKNLLKRNFTSGALADSRARETSCYSLPPRPAKTSIHLDWQEKKDNRVAIQIVLTAKEKDFFYFCGNEFLTEWNTQSALHEWYVIIKYRILLFKYKIVIWVDR